MSEPRPVEHPQLGPGKLLKTHMGGHEWEVEFASGRRFRLPAREFEPKSVAAWQPAAPTSSDFPAPRPRILELDQFRARQTLEALRFGIVPAQDVETLTIGLEAESVSLKRALARAQERGGDVQAVIGDYGFGKSHFVELAARQALRQNFLVMVASLDLLEAPPNKPFAVYHALVQSLHYPDAEHARGLEHLLHAAADRPAVLREMIELSPIADRCPLAFGLGALQASTSQAVLNDVTHWLSGDTHPDKPLKPYITGKLPRLYKTGETARLYAYLLTGISELARRLGYSGLAVLIDESEHYSLLRARQRGRADSFFTALITGATWTNGGRIAPEEIPQHHVRDCPLRFADEPHLFFMFALTESESKLPVETWLSPTQVIRLDDRYIEDDIRRFIATLVDYHALAYDYPPPDGLTNGALGSLPALLSRSLSQHRINLRELIRITVTVFDLLYVYPAYAPSNALDELKQGLHL